MLGGVFFAHERLLAGHAAELDSRAANVGECVGTCGTAGSVGETQLSIVRRRFCEQTDFARRRQLVVHAKLAGDSAVRLRVNVSASSVTRLVGLALLFQRRFDNGLDGFLLAR